MTENITIANLRQFSGSEGLHFHPLFRGIEYTDGVQWLGANGAGWLQDAILSHLCLNAKVKREEFVTITLMVKADKTAVLTFDNGNGKVLARQKFEYTDFPIHNYEVKFFCTNKVLMLASEY
jgi:hypothetical protein